MGSATQEITPLPPTTSTGQTLGQVTNKTQHSHLQGVHPNKQQLSQHEPSSVVHPTIEMSGQIHSGLVQWPSSELGSVTPFVTSQQQAKNIASTMQPIPESVAALNIQTPFSYTKGGEALSTLPLHMTTPAFTHTLGHTSG